MAAVVAEETPAFVLDDDSLVSNGGGAPIAATVDYGEFADLDELTGAGIRVDADELLNDNLVTLGVGLVVDQAGEEDDYDEDEEILTSTASPPPSPQLVPLDLPSLAPAFGAGRGGATPFGLGAVGSAFGNFYPKGGYLYVQFLEVGNLDTLGEAIGCSCCTCQAFDGGGVGDVGGLFAGCLGVPCLSCCCASPGPPQFRVALECASFERTSVASAYVQADAVKHTAELHEEVLLRSLSYCGMEKVTVSLQSKSGAVVGAATIPIRSALPQPMVRHTLDPEFHDFSLIRPVSVGGNEAGRAEALRAAAMAAPSAAAALPPMEPSDWLPRRRLLLRPPGVSLDEGVGGGSARCPYVDLRMLQLVDGALPKLRGTHPLLLAIEARQEPLVRAYVQLDIVDRLPAAERSACVSAAVEHRAQGALAQLLEHIRPSHQHLLQAIRSRAPELVELVLQSGGSGVLHPRLSGRSHARRSRYGLRGARTGRPANRSGSGRAGGAGRSSSQADGGDGASGPAARGASPPQLTPLALACSLGDVPVVEVLCQWARRERVHLDPSAPLLLGNDFAAPASPRGRGGGDVASAVAAASPWWDQEDLQRQHDGSVPCFGDPPMLMAVRGSAELSVKLRLISLLAQYGFTADVRSPVDSWTPLLAAVELGSSELVTALTKLGARMSADRNLGFTPLHLACQMEYWHLVPLLAEAMHGQHARVACWGPSPQYVSLNLVDVYGRTPLDIAILRYFNGPLPNPMFDQQGSGSCGAERQKAVDVLREFVHRKPPREAGLVCGWELVGVMRFLEGLPNKKATGHQLWPGDYCEGSASPIRDRDLDRTSPEPPARRGAEAPTSEDEGVALTPPPRRQGHADTGAAGATAATSSSASPASASGAGAGGHCPYGDLEEVLQAVRALVHIGARTQKLPADLVLPPSSSGPAGHRFAGHHAGPDHPIGAGSVKEAILSMGARFRGERSGPRYSPLEVDDFSESSVEEPAAL